MRAHHTTGRRVRGALSNESRGNERCDLRVSVYTLWPRRRSESPLRLPRLRSPATCAAFGPVHTPRTVCAHSRAVVQTTTRVL